MSRKICAPRFAILAIILALAGAAICLFVRSTLGWWGDGLFLVALGMVLGVEVGLSMMTRIPRWRQSDAPFLIGGNLGIWIMVAVWLRLPEDTIRLLGHVASTLIGVYDGLAFARLTITLSG